MKLNNKILAYKFFAIFCLIIVWSSIFGQSVEHETIELSSIPKVVIFIFSISGVAMGYIQLRISLKLAALDAKFINEISEVKKTFTKTLKEETEKIELKLRIASTEIENKMATANDLSNIEKIQTLQYNMILDKMKGLEKQLDMAASIYKRDNK